MKKTFTLLTFGLLALSSCNEEPVDFESLQNRHGIYYQVNQTEPFSGAVVQIDTVTNIKQEGVVKTGLPEGEWVGTYSNGQKQFVGEYKDGQKEGTWTYWKENGEKDRDEIYSKGERLGDFSEEEEVQLNEEKEETAEEKKADAEPKPVDFKRLVNIKIDGHYRKTLDGVPYTGHVIKYYRHGQVELRGYYKKGLRSGKWTYYRESGVIKNVKHF